MASMLHVILATVFVVGVLGQRDSRFPLTGGSSGASFGSSSSDRDRLSSSDRDRFPLTGGSRGSSSSGSDNFGFSSSNSGRDSSSSSFSEIWDSGNEDAVRTRIQAWPNAIIPYEISSDISDSNAKALRRMFDAIEDKTCVKFTQRRSEANYTLIRDGSGCSAPLGMSSRPQLVSSNRQSSSASRVVSGASVVTLASGCFTTQRVGRRVMNLLGIPHETSRPDRDQFVEINKDNIRNGYQDNLKTYSASSFLPGVLATPYDYQSVTHYTDEDIARDSKTWAIRPVRSSRFTSRDMGGQNFSQGDFDRINAAYNCRGRSSGGSSSSSSRFGSSSRV